MTTRHLLLAAIPFLVWKTASATRNEPEPVPGRVIARRTGDLFGDGRIEQIRVSRVQDWSDELDGGHLVLTVRSTGGRLLCSKDIGVWLVRLVVRDLDRDGRAEILAITETPGADHSNTNLLILGGEGVGITTLASGVASGDVEVGDYEHDGRLGSRLTNPVDADDRLAVPMSTTHDLSVYYRWRQRELRPYRQLRSDRRRPRQLLPSDPLRQPIATLAFGTLPPGSRPWAPRPTLLSGDLGDCTAPQWSPSGDRIAFFAARAGSITHGRPWNTDAWGLYVVPASGGKARRLSTGGAAPLPAPAWSPDGGMIAYCPAWNGKRHEGGITVLDSGTGRLLRQGTPFGGRHLSWRRDRDGQWAIDGEASTFELAGPSGVHAPPAAEPGLVVNDETHAAGWSVAERLRTVLLQGPANSRYLYWKPGASAYPALSPDGKRLAFTSYKSGRVSIYAAAIPTF